MSWINIPILREGIKGGWILAVKAISANKEVTLISEDSEGAFAICKNKCGGYGHLPLEEERLWGEAP